MGGETAPKIAKMSILVSITDLHPLGQTIDRCIRGGSVPRKHSKHDPISDPKKQFSIPHFRPDEIHINIMVVTKSVFYLSIL